MSSKKTGTRNFLDYRQFLVDELQRRQKRNPAYSMRAFSRDLGIGSSRLSEIINGKVGLSEERAMSLALRLQLAESERSLFVDLVQSEHARSTIARQAAQQRLQARVPASKNIAEHDFLPISDWYNLALMELLYVDGLEHSSRSFSEKLGIREEIIQETVDRLLKLGYIAWQDSRLVPCDPELATNSHVPSSAIRAYHNQILDKAKEALVEKPVEMRDFSSMVFALNSSQMEYARSRIQEFRRNLVNELEEIPGKDSVFCLSLQFFELTERK